MPILINEDASNLQEIFPDMSIQLIPVIKESTNVFMVKLRQKKINWLVKVYPKIESARAELKNLQLLFDVSEVPKIISYSIKKNFSFIVMTRFPCMDLHTHVCKFGYFTEGEIRPIVEKILVALGKIHDRDIIHRDIKPENILFSLKKDKVYIVDLEGNKYSKNYASPEQLNHKKVTYKTDMWSLGATIHLLVTGIQYRDETTGSCKISDELGPKLTDFLSCLLNPDPIGRYSCDEALNHDWLDVSSSLEMEM